jgi:hypothetical protein
MPAKANARIKPTSERNAIKSEAPFSTKPTRWSTHPTRNKHTDVRIVPAISRATIGGNDPVAFDEPALISGFAVDTGAFFELN